MNNAVKISVIIPFYNNVVWLEDAIESVLKQTLGKFEIIVVNDGSVEDMTLFLQRYDKHILYLFKENGGAATARNLALKKATGDYIAFLDSDDIWLPEKTEKQIAFMEKCGASWCHSGYYNWYPLENLMILKDNSKDFGNVYLQSFMSLRTPTPAIIIKKECFNSHPDFYFFEDMRFAQDSALWSKIAYYYPLALIDTPLVKIRQRGTNADLSSLIRFKSKTIIYHKIKDGLYKDVNWLVLFILSLYKYGGSLLKIFENRFKFSKGVLEAIGKIFWVLPFVLERLYIMFLQIGKDRNYYNNDKN